MNTSERIWAYLSEHPGADALAVAEAVGAEVVKVQRTLNKAVSRGHVTFEGKAGDRRYTLLTAPKSYAKTEEERKAKRRAWVAARRAKQPKPERKGKPMTVVRNRPVTVLQKPPHAPVNVAADVAAFLRSGGRIQKLPRGAVSQPFKRIGVAA